ncbi:PqqD family protein [Faecalicatena contorta]|uniref:Coenzyme PQQ synthesis protein D (PqqD) n=1 Tax=Faecalicatena contorta TaxID=39482 RepID=A0A315ZPQ1_9FIRM|nr:PqqD family protein [Faecalicatena contorta]MBA4701568.1 PqqD family protein [Ruminococcus sp.]PWJ47541.1 coenzyme PQQ synthesis protein D (PqqD) [Faecalicatena contorta]SUQ15930.1 Coenzyme PQQ synthesis protein D (PqqD) [Faecalicatena contorta]
MNIKSAKLKEGYILRELGGEFCIFYEKDSDNGSLTGLPSVNEACIFLWSRLEKGADTEELISTVTDKFEVSREDAEYEVGEFLAKLIHGNVVEIEQ